MSKERNIETLTSKGVQIRLREDLELLAGPHTDDCVPIDFNYLDELIVLSKDRQQTEGWIVFDCWKDGKKWLGFLAVPPNKYSEIVEEIDYLEEILKGGWLPTPGKYYQEIGNVIKFLGDPINSRLDHYAE